MTTIPIQGEHATIPVSAIGIAAQIRTRNGFDEASIKELARSIQQHGLLQPILVRRATNDEQDEGVTPPYSFTVIAGHRRLMACMRIGMQEIPASIRPTTTPEETKATQAVENLQRIDLALMDKAEGVAAMVKQAGAKRTAELLAKSPAWISEHVSLTKLPEQVRKLAEDGVTADIEILLVLRKIHKVDKPGKVLMPLLAKIRDGKASRSTVLHALKSLTNPADENSETGEEGDDQAEDDDGKAKQTEIFGTLELAEDSARRLLQAIKIVSHPKEKEDALVSYMEEFINKTWGAE